MVTGLRRSPRIAPDFLSGRHGTLSAAARPAALGGPILVGVRSIQFRFARKAEDEADYE